MDHFNIPKNTSSSKKIESKIKKNEPPHASKNNSTDNIIGQPIWYVILSIYAVLLTGLGSVTFFYNNGFAGQEENVKNLNQMKTQEQLELYKKLLNMEVSNMNQINNIANQSFNVVLGSLLGFLSASLTADNTQKDDQNSKNNTSALAPQPDQIKD
jgi:hypothetical protein